MNSAWVILNQSTSRYIVLIRSSRMEVLLALWVWFHINPYYVDFFSSSPILFKHFVSNAFHQLILSLPMFFLSYIHEDIMILLPNSIAIEIMVQYVLSLNHTNPSHLQIKNPWLTFCVYVLSEERLDVHIHFCLNPFFLSREVILRTMLFAFLLWMNVSKKKL